MGRRRQAGQAGKWRGAARWSVGVRTFVSIVSSCGGVLRCATGEHAAEAEAEGKGGNGKERKEKRESIFKKRRDVNTSTNHPGAAPGPGPRQPLPIGRNVT